MDSIPKTASFSLTANGLIVTNQYISNSVGFTPETRAIRRDGDIGSFSKSSRLRFRRLIATASAVNEDLEMWGVCLTIPGPIISQERASMIWHTWSTNNCRRSFSAFPLIWRVELQTRKQPHWHLVAFIPKGREGAKVRNELADQWKHLIRSTLSYGNSLPWSEVTDYGFETRGVRWQRVKSVEGAAKYLAATLDHETKRKQDQLGWRGRQWGIVNRKSLTSMASEPLHLYGSVVNRIIGRFKACQDARRASGVEYVGAGVGEYWRLPSVLFGRDADCLELIIREESQNDAIQS